MNYWRECILEAFDEAGIVATEQQVDVVAEIVSSSHEVYDEILGCGHVEKSFDEFKKERAKKFLEKAQEYGRKIRGL